MSNTQEPYPGSVPGAGGPPPGSTPPPPPPGWTPTPASVPPGAPAGSPPPPGSTPGHQAGTPHPGYPSANPYQAGPSLASGRPIYKPGIVPLRPLGVSDILSGSIELIRRNPGASVGVSALVLLVIMTLPLLGLLAWDVVIGLGSLEPTTIDGEEVFAASDLGALVSSLGTFPFILLATALLTGMLAEVTDRAVRGEKSKAGEAWEATRGRRGRLIALALLATLGPMLAGLLLILAAVLIGVTAGAELGIAVGVLGSIALVVATVWLYIRYLQLAVPVMMLENRGILDSMRRAGQLTQGAWWRVFGVVLLVQVIATVAGGFLSFPISLVAAFVGEFTEGRTALFSTATANSVATVLSGALTTPFIAAAVMLVYLNQRIKKEGYDITLITATSGQPMPIPPVGPAPGSPYGYPAPPQQYPGQAYPPQQYPGQAYPPQQYPGQAYPPPPPPGS